MRGKAPVTPILLMGSLGPEMQSCHTVRQHQPRTRPQTLPTHCCLSLGSRIPAMVWMETNYTTGDGFKHIYYYFYRV